jgi:hypothetical protein
MIMRWAVILNPFLGNSLVITFLQQQGKWGVDYVVCAKELKRRKLGKPAQLIVEQAILYRILKGPEFGKLMNSHC